MVPSLSHYPRSYCILGFKAWCRPQAVAWWDGARAKGGRTTIEWPYFSVRLASDNEIAWVSFDITSSLPYHRFVRRSTLDLQRTKHNHEQALAATRDHVSIYHLPRNSKFCQIFTSTTRVLATCDTCVWLEMAMALWMRFERRWPRKSRRLMRGCNRASGGWLSRPRCVEAISFYVCDRHGSSEKPFVSVAFVLQDKLKTADMSIANLDANVREQVHCRRLQLDSWFQGFLILISS